MRYVCYMIDKLFQVIHELNVKFNLNIDMSINIVTNKLRPPQIATQYSRSSMQTWYIKAPRFTINKIPLSLLTEYTKHVIL